MVEENWLKIIPDDAIYLIDRLNSHGYDAWLVGGCVRDMSLGIMPDDYDVATSALPAQVAALFERCLDTGVKHGTVTVILGGRSYEVTTYRSEGVYSDGRRPDSVSYEHDIIPDLARRDFTINSMAWHPARELLDPFGGRQDLQDRKLRCVGSANERMTEDALRQLRAVRFSLNFNLSPDEELLEAIRLHHQKIDLLSMERIRTELTRTGWAPYGIMLHNFCGTGLIARVFSRILELEADDNILCRLLAGFIQPYWQKEQIWSVYILAGLFAQICGEIPEFNEQGQLSLPLEQWQKISPGLSIGSLTRLQVLLVEKTRLSLSLSRHTQAVLMLIRLRLLLLSADRRRRIEVSTEELESRKEIRFKMILRSASRQCHLDQWQILEASKQAWEIMKVLVADDSLRAELDIDDELIRKWHSFPDEYRISPVHLPIRGNDEVFYKLQDKRQTGLYLERLLSKQLHINRALDHEEARNQLEIWLSKESVNESKLSY